MSPEPIDPKTALKKLFERHRPARDTAPEALFSSGPAEPAPAAPVARRIVDLGKLKSAGRAAASRIRAAIRQIPRSRAAAGEVVGLDLGAASIKAVRLSHGDGQPQVEQVALQEIPMSQREDSVREAVVQEHLQKLKGSGVLRGAVVMGFHHHDLVVETIRLPRMPSAELRQAVLWEAKERLSIKPEQSVIQHLTVGETSVEGQPHLEILLVSAPREVVMAQWRMMAELGLKVAAVEPTPLAGFYALERLGLWKPGEVVGHLEIGLKVSHLSLILGGMVRFSRSFPLAGDSITRAIADYCQKEYAEAEQMKLQSGLSKMALEEDRHEEGHESEDRVKVSHALGLHLEQLVAEIEHSYRYFAFELGGTDAARMDRLFLTGGGGLLKFLSEFLNSRLSVPVEVADPLKGLNRSPAVDSGLQPGWGQRLAVPLGLALRPIG